MLQRVKRMAASVVVAALVVAASAQAAPPFPPLPNVNPQANRMLRVLAAEACPNCKRLHPELTAYTIKHDYITHGVDRPRSTGERFEFRCLPCGHKWRKINMLHME